MARNDETDDGHRNRTEEGHKCIGEVVGDDARPRGLAKGSGLVLDPGGTIEHQLKEEGVEVGEMPVQDALSDAGLRGHGAAGQTAWPVA